MAVEIPQHSLSIRDGGLGLVSETAEGVFIIVGPSTAGVAGSFYTFRGPDTSIVFDTLGSGILPDQVAKHLIHSGGKTVIAYKANASTAGSNSAVTQTGGGPVVTLTGTPDNQGELVMEVLTGGALGVSSFRFSLDGGDTWSDPIATAATYLMPNGVTLNMAAGTYVVATKYEATHTAPSMTSTNVGDAMDAIIASAYDCEGVHILGQAADAAGTLTIATLLSTKIASAHLARKYIYAVMEAPAVDKALLIAAFPGFLEKFVLICAGFAEVINDRTSQIQKRSSGRLIVPRIARQPLSVHLMRDAADSELDPLPDVHKLVPDGAAASTGYHDEDRTPGLNAARFCTLRSIPAYPGFYPTNGITMASGTSDFQELKNVRIVLQAAKVWYQYGLSQLARKLRKKRGTNVIDPNLADALEKSGRAAIRTALGDDIEDARVLINRNDNITADPTVRAKVRVVVASHLLELESEIGLADALPAAA